MPHISQVASQAGLDAVKALCNSGTLTFYSGTEPVTPETALSGNTALAAWTFASTAFGSDTASGGTLTTTASFTTNPVTPTTAGTATFARLVESGGSTVVADLTVGTSATDIIINSTSLTTSIPVSLTLSLTSTYS